LIYSTGVGVPLQASICGDHGECVPVYASSPMINKISMTLNTATGRRRGLFSPVPDRKGRIKRNPMAMTGATSSRNVSKYAGSKANRANSDRK
jgi:hypothetical protein